MWVRAAAPPPAPPPPHIAVRAGSKAYGAAFAADDAAHLLQRARAALQAPPQPQPQPPPAPLPLDELLARVEAAIAAPRTPTVAADDAGLRVEARRVGDVLLLPPFAEPASAAAWRGDGAALAPAVLAVYRGRALRPAAEAGDAAAAAATDCFTFEVQLWQLASEGGGAAAAPLLIVPVMLAAWLEHAAALDGSGSGGGGGDGGNRARFDRWSERFRADVEQTSRRWRRAAGRADGHSSIVE